MSCAGGCPMAERGWETLPALAPERRQAMEFLRDHLPECDLDCYPFELFLQFADHALMLRVSCPRCGALEWEIFAHYVLFPRVNDEDLSFHRALFYGDLWPRICDLPTEEEQALAVNRWCHECASYEAQDERTASPLTVWRCGSGRCGEESAFLVSALRSVGLPARQVYAPRWAHCDDNHAWVEVLCGGEWRYLGACEPEPVLDRGWFTTAASRAILIHSRIFGEGGSPLHGEPLGRAGGAAWFNQTARYAPVRRCTFQAFVDGRSAAGAEFYLQVLNEASFHTIAKLTAGDEGTAQACLGLGSLHVLAVLDGLRAEGECGEGGIVLHLAPARGEDTPWIPFDFRAPPAGRPAPAALSSEKREERKRTLRRGNTLRERRMAGYSQPGRPEWEDLRSAARGNWDELLTFLSGPDGENREQLVRTLADKDLRDVTRRVLEDHFSHLPPKRAGVPEEVYWKWTACPRIGLEGLTPWRGPLLAWLSGRTQEPAALWQEMDSVMKPRDRAYGNLCWTPEAALKAGGCDESSKRLLFVAALRALGIPARLRPLDGAPEHWEEGAFRLACPEAMGALLLSCLLEKPLRAGQDWSISRRMGNAWRLLVPEEGDWKNGWRLALPAGQYRVATTVRLPSGDQLALRREVLLTEGEERPVRLQFRPWVLDDLLTNQELPALRAKTLSGEEIPDLFRMGGGAILVLWLEEGGEPTEHMLNELMERRAELAVLPVRVFFLVRGRESLRQPTLARALARLEGAQVMLDDWAYDLEAVARHLGRDAGSPPLAVVSDGGGRAVYSVSGYRVGAAELLLQAAGHCASTHDRGMEPDREKS